MGRRAAARDARPRPRSSSASPPAPHRLRPPDPRAPPRRRPRRPAACLDPRHRGRGRDSPRPRRRGAAGDARRRRAPPISRCWSSTIRRARRPRRGCARRVGRGVPVASLHDVGIAPLASDLAVDGSLGARRVDGLGVERGGVPARARPTRSSAAGPCAAAAVARPRPVGAAHGRWSVWAEGSRPGRARALPGISARNSIAFRGSSRARVLLSLGLDSSADSRAARRCRSASRWSRRPLSRGAGAGDGGGGRRRHDALRGVCARHAGGRGAGGARPGDDGPALRAGRPRRRRPERGRRRHGRVGPGGGCGRARPAGRPVAPAATLSRRGRLAVDGRARRGWRARSPRCGRRDGADDEDEEADEDEVRRGDATTTATAMRIGTRAIGGGAPLFVIAEIGLNHDGDPARALALVDAAAARRRVRREAAVAARRDARRARSRERRRHAGARRRAVAARRLRALRAGRGGASRRRRAGARARPGLALESLRRGRRRHAGRARLRRAEDRQRRHHASPADRARRGDRQAARDLDRAVDARRSGRGRDLRPRGRRPEPRPAALRLGLSDAGRSAEPRRHPDAGDRLRPAGRALRSHRRRRRRRRRGRARRQPLRAARQGVGVRSRDRRGGVVVAGGAGAAGGDRGRDAGACWARACGRRRRPSRPNRQGSRRALYAARDLRGRRRDRRRRRHRAAARARPAGEPLARADRRADDACPRRLRAVPGRGSRRRRHGDGGRIERRA